LLTATAAVSGYLWPTFLAVFNLLRAFPGFAHHFFILYFLVFLLVHLPALPARYLFIELLSLNGLILC